MGHRQQLVTPLVVAAALAAPVAMSACASGGARVYDPYYTDWHRWNRDEDGLYLQWERDTRRDHLDFGRRPALEQRAYFDWRHRR